MKITFLIRSVFPSTFNYNLSQDRETDSNITNKPISDYLTSYFKILIIKSKI